jgi:hypothetical protein
MAEQAASLGPPRSKEQNERDSLRRQIGKAKAKSLATDEASRLSLFES